MSKGHRLSVGLSDQEFGALQRIAEEHRVSLAWVGRKAISDFLAAHTHEEHEPLLPTRDAQKGIK